MKNGEIKVYRHPDNVMSLCWKDKRPICMLSTWHNGESATTSRIVRGGRREEIEKPLVISDYTENMGAVDIAESLLRLLLVFKIDAEMVEEAVFLDARGELGQLFHPIQAGNSPTKSHSA